MSLDCKIPLPSNSRIRSDETKTKLFTFKVSTLKSAQCNNFVLHSLSAYLLYFQFELVSYYMFDLDPECSVEKILKFFSFYQFIPIFLTLQSFLQIDSNKSKQLCIPLALCAAMPVIALYNVCENGLTGFVLILIAFHIILVLNNILAYLRS